MRLGMFFFLLFFSFLSLIKSVMQWSEILIFFKSSEIVSVVPKIEMGLEWPSQSLGLAS